MTPGATLVLSGKGFGTFKLTQFNRVTVNGVSALVQRWDREVIEVKVPLKLTSGFVEVLIGKKKLLAGFVNLAMPRIETITPTEAERGMTLQITGHHFGLSAGAIRIPCSVSMMCWSAGWWCVPSGGETTRSSLKFRRTR